MEASWKREMVKQVEREKGKKPQCVRCFPLVGSFVGFFFIGYFHRGCAYKQFSNLMKMVLKLNLNKKKVGGGCIVQATRARE